MPTYPRLPENSDWEKVRSQSNWHFDYKKPPISNDSYQPVCKFIFNLNTLTKQVFENRIPSNIILDQNLTGKIDQDKEKFTFTSQNLFLTGGNPYIEDVQSYNVSDIDLFKKFAESLGLTIYIIRLNVQKPGQMIPAHIDELGSFKKYLEKNNIDVDIENNSTKALRFAIMLDDWKLGQFFQFGNATWHQWSKGECVTWDWKNIPHCTGNAGYWDRPMLQITGLTSYKTFELLNSKDKIINLEI